MINKYSGEEQLDVHQSHKLEVVGSNPTSATKNRHLQQSY